jgi:hypothetical protein
MIMMYTFKIFLQIVRNRRKSDKRYTSHNVVSSTPRLSGIRTDCIGSCKSNYHTITTTTAPVATRDQTQCWYCY